MMYQMLTGKLPRGMAAPPSAMMPGLDPRLDAIVQRAMKENRQPALPKRRRSGRRSMKSPRPFPPAGAGGVATQRCGAGADGTREDTHAPSASCGESSAASGRERGHFCPSCAGPNGHDAKPRSECPRARPTDRSRQVENAASHRARSRGADWCRVVLRDEPLLGR